VDATRGLAVPKTPVRPEWDYYEVALFKFRVQLKSGEHVYPGTIVLRRRLDDGRWEYRWPTEDEADEYQRRDAW
jgi:hypothetical protein